MKRFALTAAMLMTMPAHAYELAHPIPSVTNIEGFPFCRDLEVAKQWNGRPTPGEPKPPDCHNVQKYWPVIIVKLETVLVPKLGPDEKREYACVLLPPTRYAKELLPDCYWTKSENVNPNYGRMPGDRYEIPLDLTPRDDHKN